MLNQISLMGRLTADPELRYTNNKTPVATFTIAVDRDVSANGDKETDFINCVAWRASAEFISKYFGKGTMISVIGRLQIRTYQDKSGNNRHVAEVVVEKSYFCGGKEKADVYTPKPKKPEFIDMDDETELPF